MDQPDILQLGVSASNHDVLSKLQSEGVFEDMVDAYKFAIGMGIASDRHSDSITQRQNMYSRMSIDADGALAQTVRLLWPEIGQPYRFMELLADWGLSELQRLRSLGEVDLAHIIREAQEEKR